MLVLNTGDPKEERETVARLILSSCGIALRDAPEEYVSTTEHEGVTFHIHGIEGEDGYDVLVMEDPDPENEERDPVALCLLRIDPEDGALLYSRVLDDDEDGTPTDNALLMRAALEEVLGIDPEQDLPLAEEIICQCDSITANSPKPQSSKKPPR